MKEDVDKKDMRRKNHDLRGGADWSGLVRDLAVFFPLARLDLLHDIVGDFSAHWPVGGQLVQRGYLGRTMWTDEVLFKQMGLNAILAVSRPATWCFDGVPEDLTVDRAHDAWVL